MPELQLVNANSLFGYSNFMGYFIFGLAAEEAAADGPAAFQPNYQRERALAADPSALVEHLDLLLTAAATSEQTKARIIEIISGFPLTAPDDPSYDGELLRVGIAIQLLMTSPDYLVQR